MRPGSGMGAQKGRGGQRGFHIRSRPHVIAVTSANAERAGEVHTRRILVNETAEGKYSLFRTCSNRVLQITGWVRSDTCDLQPFRDPTDLGRHHRSRPSSQGGHIGWAPRPKAKEAGLTLDLAPIGKGTG